MSTCSMTGCSVHANRTGAGLCEKHYMRIRRHGANTVFDRPDFQSLEDAFTFYTPHRPQEGCWLWCGRFQSRGYGLLNWNGEKLYAHRIAWFLSSANWPGDMFVLHHCDNPPCVRFDHLFLGTQHDNARDMFMKGRARGPAGERNPKAKLTSDQVADIHKQLTNGVHPRVLADRFSVSVFTIYNIRSGRTWRGNANPHEDISVNSARAARDGWIKRGPDGRAD